MYTVYVHVHVLHIARTIRNRNLAILQVICPIMPLLKSGPLTQLDEYIDWSGLQPLGQVTQGKGRPTKRHELSHH